MGFLAINQGTQSNVNFDLSGTINTQVVGVGYGTINTLGTLPNVPGGTINVGTFAQLSGTQNVGTVNTGTINTGTVNLGTFVGKDANAAAQGGNPIGVGGTDSGGTIRTLGVDSLGRAQVVVQVGTVNVATISSLPNLPQGSINVTSGTVSAGTINAGTFREDMTPVVMGTSYGTQGTTGAAVWGTLIAAAGAGTRQYVSGIDLVVVSGTVEVAVTNIGISGSVGNGVLVRGNFPAGAGISKNFNPVQASATNGTIAWWLGGAGTVDVVVQYWQGV